ncbi:excalibur calcium-binding domain-containing protein [Cellulomonas sp. SLBN-39]|uniref:excalibur calcium-binding domain-containing protein n=1 Tax=Cellulomonas sp. SLBN-39 TaxID=2768446 RepID=UPI00135A1182|nr:excalibur calcium-binding domain-containing protein [Cellulomonas sp. SLBN-39]
MEHRSRAWLTPALAVVLVLVGLVPAGAARADEPDVDPPVVALVDVAPAVVDVTEGPGTVEVTLQVADASGVAGPVQVALAGPSQDAVLGPVDAVLAAGSATDGTHVAEVVVPQDAAVGSWDVVVTAADVLGTTLPASTVGAVDVVRVVPDVQAPVLSGPVVTASAGGDLRLGTVTVTASFVLHDPAGVDVPTVRLTPPTGDPVEAQASLTSGDVQEGTWTAALAVPRGAAAGTWTARLPAPADLLGNVAPEQTLGTVTLRYSTPVPGAPTITGTARVGSTLTAVPGSWLPGGVTFAYRWLRDGKAIAGATGPTYKVVTADAGRTLKVEVRGTAAGATSVASATRSVERLLTATPVPTVSGTARVGSTLTATAGSWKPAPVTLAYQWRRDGAAIPGATARTYRLVTADAGAVITVQVRGSRTGYTPVARTSAARRAERLLTATPVPTISGAGRVGSRLTASAGAWRPSPVTLTYQWRRNGAAIAGATSRTYVLTKADAGASVTVSVRGTRSGYTPVARTSAGRSVDRLLTATPTPKITGTRLPGKVLTAAPGAWKPSSVALSYQWRRNGAAISGATGRTYTVRTADAGAAISVVVTGRRAGYTTVARASAAVRIGPARPADKDCADFSTWSAAQAWFLKYFPHYGDVARLDGDNDRIACESLPGAP